MNPPSFLLIGLRRPRFFFLQLLPVGVALIGRPWNLPAFKPPKKWLKNKSLYYTLRSKEVLKQFVVKESPQTHTKYAALNPKP